MLLTPCGVDFVKTLLYHLEALQLSFFSCFLSSPTLSEGYNTISSFFAASGRIGRMSITADIPHFCSALTQLPGFYTSFFPETIN